MTSLEYQATPTWSPRLHTLHCSIEGIISSNQGIDLSVALLQVSKVYILPYFCHVCVEEFDIMCMPKSFFQFICVSATCYIHCTVVVGTFCVQKQKILFIDKLILFPNLNALQPNPLHISILIGCSTYVMEECVYIHVYERKRIN